MRFPWSEMFIYLTGLNDGSFSRRKNCSPLSATTTRLCLVYKEYSENLIQITGQQCMLYSLIIYSRQAWKKSNVSFVKSKEYTEPSKINWSENKLVWNTTVDVDCQNTYLHLWGMALRWSACDTVEVLWKPRFDFIEAFSSSVWLRLTFSWQYKVSVGWGWLVS